MKTWLAFAIGLALFGCGQKLPERQNLANDPNAPSDIASGMEGGNPTPQPNPTVSPDINNGYVPPAPPPKAAPGNVNRLPTTIARERAGQVGQGMGNAAGEEGN